MRFTLCYLVVASGAGAVAGTSAKAAAAGIPRQAGAAGGGSAFDGLSDSLKSGGVDGLMAALSGMQAAQPAQDSHVVRDPESGMLMYDFAHTTTDAPETTPAPPATALPLLVAAKAAVPPPPPRAVPAKPAASTFMAPAVAAPAVLAKPAASTFMAPTVPVAAAAPAAPLVAPPAAPAAPVAGAGVGSGALADLAARLDSVRQQVDTLSAQADAAVAGAPMYPAAAPQVPPQFEAEIQVVLRRVSALETENKKLHEQVDSQSARLAKMQGAQKADEQELGQLKAESDNITTLIHRKHHRKPAKAQ